jgi:hypothetical protein
MSGCDKTLQPRAESTAHFSHTQKLLSLRCPIGQRETNLSWLWHAAAYFGDRSQKRVLRGFLLTSTSRD